MKEITKVVVDAMGGDNAPHEIIKGAVEAVGKSDAIHVILVGKTMSSIRNFPGTHIIKNRFRLFIHRK